MVMLVAVLVVVVLTVVVVEKDEVVETFCSVRG